MKDPWTHMRDASLGPPSPIKKSRLFKLVGPFPSHSFIISLLQYEIRVFI